MSEDRPSWIMRDQVPTAFAAALRRLVRAIPGGVAAAFCDLEGECVDYYGDLDTFDLKIAGAQFGPFHEDLGRRLGGFLGGAPVVHLRSERTSYLYVPVTHEYYVVAILTAFASWWESLDDVEAMRRDLMREAGVG